MRRLRGWLADYVRVVRGHGLRHTCEDCHNW